MRLFIVFAHVPGTVLQKKIKSGKKLKDDDVLCCSSIDDCVGAAG